MTNMLEDKVDYAPKTKALLEYLAKKTSVHGAWRSSEQGN